MFYQHLSAITLTNFCPGPAPENREQPLKFSRYEILLDYESLCKNSDEEPPLLLLETVLRGVKDDVDMKNDRLNLLDLSHEEC